MAHGKVGTGRNERQTEGRSKKGQKHDGKYTISRKFVIKHEYGIFKNIFFVISLNLIELI